jgi:hypothetical protein
MSELLDVQGEEGPMLWRVRKGPDDSIYGPVDPEALKEWANSAQIAPEDMIDESDENWRPAPDVDFLEMLWLVKLSGGETYGPTTVGTLREFINEGLVTEKTLATHVKTNQSLPLTALIAAVDFEIPDPPLPPVDVANAGEHPAAEDCRKVGQPVLIRFAGVQKLW